MIATMNHEDLAVGRCLGRDHAIGQDSLHFTLEDRLGGAWPVKPNGALCLRPKHPGPVPRLKLPNAIWLSFPIAINAKGGKPPLKLVQRAVKPDCHAEIMAGHREIGNREARFFAYADFGII